MKWNKKGLIFCANSETSYMKIGGRTPVPLLIGEDVYRIYFSSYDENGRGRIYSLLININNPLKFFELNTNPLINIGNVGFYDDNGIITSSILKHNDKVYLYTTGFSLKNKIIFDAASGLAISKDNGKSFQKFNGPIIDRTIYDPCFAASPCVINDNSIFKMWYVSCKRWETQDNGKYKHFYNIKYKESEDGIHWEIKSKVAIDFQNKYEYAISRPSVIKDTQDDYKMWYSFRAQENIENYRIGYAESKDGINWTRKDEEAGIDISEEGWDSEMICYPYVFDHKGKRYMLYNGNGYGKSGFGLAVLEKSSG